jgi:acyl dehydratase
MTTSSMMGGPVGMYFSRYAVAYLEHSARFKAPVRVGDTLRIGWTIVERIDKPSVDGGIVVLAGTCHNQLGILVAEADAKMLVGRGLAARLPASALTA